MEIHRGSQVNAEMIHLRVLTRPDVRDRLDAEVARRGARRAEVVVEAVEACDGNVEEALDEYAGVTIGPVFGKRRNRLNPDGYVAMSASSVTFEQKLRIQRLARQHRVSVSQLVTAVLNRHLPRN